MYATIINIGDELLSGDTVNTNASWLSKRLVERGIEVKKVLVIEDDIQVIAKEINDCMTDLLFITGGLGPTHDDITREGVALAFGVPLVRDQDALAMMRARYDLTEPSLVMADLPKGSVPIENPVGVAPGFIINDSVYIIPGVPREMKGMFAKIEHLFEGENIYSETIVCFGGKESELAKLMKESTVRYPSVKVGSYPSTEVIEGGDKPPLRIKLSGKSAVDIKIAKDFLEREIFSKKRVPSD